MQMLFAITTHYDLDINQIDVKTVSLYKMIN